MRQLGEYCSGCIKGKGGCLKIPQPREHFCPFIARKSRTWRLAIRTAAALPHQAQESLQGSEHVDLWQALVRKIMHQFQGLETVKPAVEMALQTFATSDVLSDSGPGRWKLV